ncbi:MAG: hypothetical protein JW871_00955, partial [Endomicrobiales bacterium]|nr:hypothetical protein [Endomicrobiales bacterium]
MNIKKLISIITCICFVFSFIISQPLHAIVERKRDTERYKDIFDSFLLPTNTGRITESFDARCSILDARSYISENRESSIENHIVINIQDLHCHPEVQRNISKILSILDKKYGLKNVYVEGACGAIDTSWLGSVEDKKLRAKVLDALIDGGKLSGAEHYSVVSGKSDLLVGVENRKLHTSNILRLNDISSKQKTIENLIDNLKSDLDSLQDDYFNADNKKLNKIIEKYKNGEIKPKKYYEYIIKKADNLELDLHYYENLSNFARSFTVSKELKYKHIAKEMQGFIALLKQKLPFSIYSMLVERTSNFSQANELYIYLSKIAEKEPELLSRFPNLKKFFDNLKFSQTINPLELINEEQSLLDEIRARQAQDQSEREVVFLIEFTRYLKDYLNYKISANNHCYVKQNLSRFNLLWARYVGNDKLSQITPYMELLNEYYQVNIDRNECLLDNCGINKEVRSQESGVRIELKENKTLNSEPWLLTSNNGKNREHKASSEGLLNDADEVIVLITGGFHTPGLCELFRQKGYSYIVITPNVTKDTGFSESVYSELLAFQSAILKAEYRVRGTGDTSKAHLIEMGTVPAFNVACRKGTVPISDKRQKHTKYKVSVPHALKLLFLSMLGFEEQATVAASELMRLGTLEEVNDALSKLFGKDRKAVYFEKSDKSKDEPGEFKLVIVYAKGEETIAKTRYYDRDMHLVSHKDKEVTEEIGEKTGQEIEAITKYEFKNKDAFEKYIRNLALDAENNLINKTRKNVIYETSPLWQGFNLALVGLVESLVPFGIYMVISTIFGPVALWVRAIIWGGVIISLIIEHVISDWKSIDKDYQMGYITEQQRDKRKAEFWTPKNLLKVIGIRVFAGSIITGLALIPGPIGFAALLSGGFHVVYDFVAPVLNLPPLATGKKFKPGIDAQSELLDYEPRMFVVPDDRFGVVGIQVASDRLYRIFYYDGKPCILTPEEDLIPLEGEQQDFIIYIDDNREPVDEMIIMESKMPNLSERKAIRMRLIKQPGRTLCRVMHVDNVDRRIDLSRALFLDQVDEAADMLINALTREENVEITGTPYDIDVLFDTGNNVSILLSDGSTVTGRIERVIPSLDPFEGETVTLATVNGQRITFRTSEVVDARALSETFSVEPVLSSKKHVLDPAKAWETNKDVLDYLDELRTHNEFQQYLSVLDILFKTRNADFSFADYGMGEFIQALIFFTGFPKKSIENSNDLEDV